MVDLWRKFTFFDEGISIHWFMEVGGYFGVKLVLIDGFYEQNEEEAEEADEAEEELTSATWLRRSL